MQSRRALLQIIPTAVVSALTTACTRSPIGPAPIPGGPVPPQQPPQPQRQFSGTTTFAATLISVLRQANLDVGSENEESNPHLVRDRLTGKRRFIGLDGKTGSEWAIFLADSRYGIGQGDTITLDMPTVELPAKTKWRVEKLVG